MGPDVVNGDDVGMVKRSGCASFLFETPQAVGIADRSRPENFDGYIAIKTAIAGPIHISHAPIADFPEDSVVT